MIEGIRAGAGILVELAVFFCAGSLLIDRLKMKAEASLSIIFGYLLYFAVFEVLVLPMTLAWVPLNVLCIVWGLLSAVTVLVAVVRLGKKWKGQLAEWGKISREHGWMLLLVVGVVLLQVLVVVLYEDTTMDAAYYVGTVSTSVYTGTLGRYDPYTGEIYKHFLARYVFSTYPMNSAMWCRILNIHPMVQAKIVLSSIHVLVANLIIYQIGKRLFRGGKKQADLMVCFVCLMQLFSYTIYTQGTFFFTRSYEGKAILGNVIFPVVLYCAIWFWQEKEDKRLWLILFLVSASAVAFSGSSIILPVAVSAGILPTLFRRKQFSAILPYVLSMAPTFAYAAAYFAAKYGWLALRAS
jgi:hypothetical protein